VQRLNLSQFGFATLLLIAANTIPLQSAKAQTYTVLHNFTGGQDGANPYAGLTINGANLYGTALDGGRGPCTGLGHSGCGTVFQLKKRGTSWTFDPLYSFAGGGSDGGNPWGRVMVGPDGALYGTTLYEGEQGFGTAFSLRPSATFCRAVL
jgi:uncharacterized repeat protein (TIGR03803 family)